MTQQSKPSWLVQIYELSDEISQEILAGLLAGVSKLAVDAQSTPTDCFLIVECVDSAQAQWVRDLVTSVDHRARLIHTASGPRPQVQSAA
jgi:hypothetical protein